MKSKTYSVFCLAVFLVTGCSTLSRNEFNRDYEILFPDPVVDSLTIYIEANNNETGNKTAMIPAGGAFMVFSTGQKRKSKSKYNEGKIDIYGNRLSELLVASGAVKKSEYFPQPPQKTSSPFTLFIRFDKTYQGATGWPMKIEATFFLKENGETVFEKNYKESGGMLDVIGACHDCYASDIAEKKINEAFLTDLLKWQQERNK